MVFVKKVRERTSHVLMKALLWALYLPAIIGRMGINIAEAQKALNTDYIETLHKVFNILRAIDPPGSAALDQDTINWLAANFAEPATAFE